MDVTERIGTVGVGGAAIVIDAAGKGQDHDDNSNERSGKACHVSHQIR